MEKVYGVKLKGYDEQYEDCIIARKTLKGAIDLAHKILHSTRGFSLMDALNDIQSDVGAEGVFESKYTIPLSIINLITEKYGILVGIFDQYVGG